MALLVLIGTARPSIEWGHSYQLVVFSRKIGTIYRPDALALGPIFNLRGGPARQKPVKRSDAIRRSCRLTASPLLKGEAVKSNVQDPLLAPPQRRKGHSRPSLLDRITLSDGRLAWPVAKAAGVQEATFRARLSAGVPPDDAVLSVKRVVMSRGERVPQASLPCGRPRLSDGRLAQPLAKAAGVSAAAFHYRLKAGWSPDEAIKPVRRRSSARVPQA